MSGREPPTLARRLLAPAPGWEVETDVVVVGSGVAGLTTALAAREAGRVLLVTKTEVDAGSTRWAQGGIAAALGLDDSPDDHYRDTLVAGAGLCDEAAVRVLVDEGAARVRELAALGAAFDTDPDGAMSLTREGGHGRRRIVHAGGDATGAEVSRALVAAVHGDPRIELYENSLVLDLLTDATGRACGVTLHVLGQGSRDGVGAVRARAVVLATGGLGQVFSSTTNPSVATGDGTALALRAGAEVADLEFVQFHPTALWLGRGSTGQQPLVSEAVRGEGAVLRDDRGERVMAGVHPQEDLAPRDVVAKRMHAVMAERGLDHLELDTPPLGEELLLSRFPTIVTRCREAGVDPVRERVPVVPAAHYASGGVRTDLHGRTAVPGLYACGEVACTGVHGANRLASNSLLEGLVFAERIGADLRRALASEPPPGAAVPAVGPAGLVPATSRRRLQEAMTSGAGVLRDDRRLASVADALVGVAASAASASASASAGAGARAGAGLVDGAVPEPGPQAWETTGLHAVATALVQGAAVRRETRGSHWRTDTTEQDPRWRVRLVQHLDAAGRLCLQEEPVGRTSR